MVAYTEVARAESARGEVVLRQRHDGGAGPHAPVALELRVNGVFVMDTLETTSERGLAAAAMALVTDPRNVLVGGLGLGFTMHEVLADERVERLVVVEIEDPLVQWMRDGTVPHGPSYLADERVSVVTADIRRVLAEATPECYDLVLLDVDNGPDFLVFEDNQAIYERTFLERTRAALRPGGALVIWSAAESAALDSHMREAFDNVVAVRYPVTLQSRTADYWLYLSRNT